MADKAITSLTAASALTGDEVLHVVQSGNSRQTPVSSIVALAGAEGAVETENVKNGLGQTFAKPNLFPDPDFKFAAITANAIWSPLPVVGETSDGRLTATFTNTSGYAKILAADIAPSGTMVSYQALIESATYVSGGANATILRVEFYDSADAEMTSERIVLRSVTSGTPVTTPTVVSSVPTAMPSGAVTVRFSTIAQGNAGNTLTYSRPVIVRDLTPDFRPSVTLSTLRTVIVDGTNGADTGDGTLAAPFATEARARRALRNKRDATVNGRILFRGGDYTNTSVTLGSISGSWIGNVGHLVIEAYNNERVRFINGTACVGSSFAKTATKTNVYELAVARAVSPTGPGTTGAAKFIHEHETGEGTISLAERHPLHLGQTYRSPSTRLRSVADVATVDSTPSSFFYDTGTQTLYIHAPGSGNPTSNGKTYYIPAAHNSNGSGYGNAGFGGCGDAGYYTNYTAIGHITVRNIEVWYASRGFDMQGVGSYLLENCTSVGARFQGFYFAGFGVDRNCRSIASGQDGFGGYVNATAPGSTFRSYRSESFNPYACHGGDDGRSQHQFANDTVVGGLFEYNDDTGSAYVLGAEASLYGTEFRKNGQMLTDGAGAVGEGITIRQAPDANEGGVNSCVAAYHCVSDGNTYNFSCGGGGANMRLVQCISMNAANVGYRTLNSGDRMDAIACLTINDAAAKAVASGSTLNIITPSALS